MKVFFRIYIAYILFVFKNKQMYQDVWRSHSHGRRAHVRQRISLANQMGHLAGYKAPVRNVLRIFRPVENWEKVKDGKK